MKPSNPIKFAFVFGLLAGVNLGWSQTTVFSDDFSSSSLNSATPTAPTATSTSYETISTKALSTASIAAGHLDLGFGTTSGNGYEAQALFSTSPVTLATVGDSLDLMVTFTVPGGLLSTNNGTLSAGLYNSGGLSPWAGGVNNASSANITAATGAAQNWVGYVGQIAWTGNKSQINTRIAQTGTGNNNQDVTTGGSVSSSKGYANPAPIHVVQSTTVGVTLAPGDQCTLLLQYNLTAPDTLAITNSLFSGADTSGTLLSELDTTASGADFLTNSFDGLAFGFYANASQDTSMDINQISVMSSVQAVPEPSVFALAGLGLLGLAARFRRN
jgi:PEP-CTERM motif